MRGRAVVLAAAIIMAPLAAKAADLVVWWDKGYYAQEDDALREIIAAFEQETGKQVELVLLPPYTFTSGRACSSAQVSPSRTSRGSGLPSGPSGATKCNRPCVEPLAATTSGVLACPCRMRAWIPTSHFLA
jgi:hypothetical protein